MVRRRGPHPTTGRSLRVALETERHMALLYSASDVHWYTDAQLAEHPYLRKLGLGLLDPQTTAEAIAERARSRPFQGRRLATLLLVANGPLSLAAAELVPLAAASLVPLPLSKAVQLSRELMTPPHPNVYIICKR